MYRGEYKHNGDYVIMNAQPYPNYDLRPLFAHEMTHAFQAHHWNSNNLSEIFGPGPGTWVKEGMAEYVATQVITYPELSLPTGTIRDHGYEEGYYQTALNTFEEQQSVNLNSMTTWPNEWYPKNYIVYESIIYFLEKKYGHDNLMKWLQLVSDGNSLTYATNEAFGKAEGVLIQEWKTYFSIK
jgi:hypothetical protein